MFIFAPLSPQSKLIFKGIQYSSLSFPRKVIILLYLLHNRLIFERLLQKCTLGMGIPPVQKLISCLLIKLFFKLPALFEISFFCVSCYCYFIYTNLNPFLKHNMNLNKDRAIFENSHNFIF